jgi:hypothetical protein
MKQPAQVTSEQLCKNARYFSGLKRVHVNIAEAELIVDDYILKVLSDSLEPVTHWEMYLALGCNADSPLVPLLPQDVEFIVFWRMHMLSEAGFIYETVPLSGRAAQWRIA